MTSVATLSTHPFGDSYAKVIGALPGASESWIEGLRQTSRAKLNTHGLPTKKVESWKYTSLKELIKIPFIPLAKADDVDVTVIPVSVPIIEGSLRLVFVNGVFRTDLSDPVVLNGVGYRVQSLAQDFARAPSGLKSILGTVANPDASVITALNTRFIEDGIVLSVESGTTLQQPIHIISIGASGAIPGSFHPRFEIELGASAQATVIESHVGLPGQPYLTNPVSEIAVGAEALLKHYTLLDDDSDGFHLGRTDVRVDRAGHYDSFVLSMGGKLVRREIRVILDQDKAEARVDGAYGIANRQHNDFHSEILHLAPKTVSHQSIRGVLGGQSRGVFQGRIHVAREAQGADGRQLHKALLLNRGPEVDCKPELEIYADDVQCAHGATTGALDKDHLFYLLSRGIDESSARALLVEGFLDDVVLDISDASAQQLILDSVKGWLARQTTAVGRVQ